MKKEWNIFLKGIFRKDRCEGRKDEEYIDLDVYIIIYNTETNDPRFGVGCQRTVFFSSFPFFYPFGAASALELFFISRPKVDSSLHLIHIYNASFVDRKKIVSQFISGKITARDASRCTNKCHHWLHFRENESPSTSTSSESRIRVMRKLSRISLFLYSDLSCSEFVENQTIWKWNLKIFSQLHYILVYRYLYFGSKWDRSFRVVVVFCA